MDPVLNLDPALSILLYGDTQTGKTYQVGELAEHIGLYQHKRTVVFQADLGGIAPIKPQISQGLVEIIRPHGGDAHVWIARAVQGERWNGKEWVSALTDDVGLVVHEGVTAYCALMMMDLAQRQARGLGVGGEKTFILHYMVEETVINLSNNNQVHYMLAQRELQDLLYRRQVRVPTLWTALVRRDDEGEAASKKAVIGPMATGSALTAILPSLFDLAFRIDAEPNVGGAPTHKLYLNVHKDPNAAGTKAFAGSRLPRRGASVKVPSVISPASVVEALLAIQARNDAAAVELAAEMKKE